MRKESLPLVYPQGADEEMRRSGNSHDRKLPVGPDLEARAEMPVFWGGASPAGLSRWVAGRSKRGVKYHRIVKLYVLLSAALSISAHAQTAAPKPAAPRPPVAKPAVKPAPVTLDPNRVVATVGNEKLTAAQFDAIVSGIDPKSQAEIRGPAKRQFMDNLALIMVLARQAQIMHFDQHPLVQQQIQFNRERLLANEARKAMIEKATVPLDAMHKYFDDHKGDFQQISARHILVRFQGSPVAVKEGQKDRSEEEALAYAKELVTRLKGGADFAEMAKAESADVATASRGGEIGAPFRRGHLAKSFDDAAFGLAVGEISNPVRTDFGYHIIRVDAMRFEPFDEVKGEIEKILKPQIAQKQIEELRSRVAVTLDDKFFSEKKDDKEK